MAEEVEDADAIYLRGYIDGLRHANEFITQKVTEISETVSDEYRGVVTKEAYNRVVVEDWHGKATSD